MNPTTPYIYNRLRSFKSFALGRRKYEKEHSLDNSIPNRFSAYLIDPDKGPGGSPALHGQDLKALLT